jgi:formylglycine-generating enzyme required for sulfatase activity
VRVEKDGHAPYEVQVTLSAGEVRTLRTTLTPLLAGLVVRSNVTNDRVTIDARDYGSSGPERHELKPGTYTVRVKKTGYKPYEKPVSLAAGETRTVHARLERIAPAVASGMVRVPAGEFHYGCNASVDSQCDDDEKPGKRVTLPAFTIDKTEVTVSAYEACVNAGACTKPNTGTYCNWGKSGRGDHPINCVDWNQAKAYCSWAGKRLPTEQEWEKAARGTDGRKYPWGNQSASCARAVMNDGGTGCGDNKTWPVGSKPSGASPYGAQDMAGNVWEWTSDWYDSKKKGRVLRGGSWYGGAWFVRASNRYRRGPSARYYNDGYGFRCAQ